MTIQVLKRTTTGLPVAALALLLAGGVAVAAQGGRTASPSGAATQLVAIRAAHHAGFDRLVFEFSGAVPNRRRVRYVNRLIADPSGRSVAVAGRAILEASFFAATARNRTSRATAPSDVAFALPNVVKVVRSGDFESVLSYGVGLAKRTSFHVSTLTRPSRVVVDIATPFRTVLRRVYFENLPRFRAGTTPYVTKVLRPVPAGAPAIAVMDRLFAGPTPSEYAAGLRLQASRATGFTEPSISNLVARIRLTGGCASAAQP